MATTQKEKEKIEIDTALPLQQGSADRALAEVMRELSEVSSGGAMSRMSEVISTHFPTEQSEVDKFLGLLDRLKRAAEGTYSIAIGEQNARRSKG